MRILGWALVIVLFLASGFFLFAASRASAQLDSREMRQYVRTLSSPLLNRYRPDIVAEGVGHVRGLQVAESWLLGLGVGAGALGIISTVIMASTTRRRSRSARGGECVACGAEIWEGTLCAECGR